MKKYTKKDYVKLYLDYLNNFITLKGFSNYYGLSEKQAEKIIEKGKFEQAILAEKYFK